MHYVTYGDRPSRSTQELVRATMITRRLPDPKRGTAPMCYAKPGPRCSSHARAKMDAARDDYDSAIIARDQIPEPWGPRTADNDDEYLALDAADAAIMEASAAYAKASREYQTTPEGIRALEDQIERALAGSSVSGQSLASLYGALQRGRRTRSEQLAAFATRATVTALTNKELKEELADLIEHRMPSVSEDPDGLMIEQARFSAVLDEMEARRTNGTWGTSTGSRGAPPSYV